MIKLDLTPLSDYISKAQSQIEAGFESACYKGANHIVDELKSNTPVDTGRLRSSWYRHGVTKSGSTYTCEILNKAHYCDYVEYGHRQEVGRYVPAIGKRLVRAYVRGRYFIKRTVNTLPDDRLDEICIDEIVSKF